MRDQVTILSPCGMLGYGFPVESFERAFDFQIDGIVVDAGSTDAGPHKLGANTSIVSKTAVKKDLMHMIRKGIAYNIPIIIGSAGGAGAQAHVEQTLFIIEEILKEFKMTAKIGVIWADVEGSYVAKALKAGYVVPLSPNIPPLTEDTLTSTTTIVAQMGHETIVEALEQQCDIIVCGRSYDPSPFAALGIFYGMDKGLSYHLGKILECGALCATPGTTKDCIIGTIYEDHFTVQALNPARVCTPTTVAAHTFYEKEHPYLLQGPGFTLDLQHCTFTDVGEGVVAVRNSIYREDDVYRVKLEGARKVAYRTFVLAGVRDPVLIDQLDAIEQAVREQVRTYFSEVSSDQYTINFYYYGKDAVLGAQEPMPFNGHEIGIMFEVLAQTQELATTICANVRSTYLHYGYPNRKSSAGNLAFPFAPSDVEFGPVYEFSIYHLMTIADNPFRLDLLEVAHEII